MADPLDVITLAQAKRVLSGLRGPTDDDKVAGFITAVSRRLDEACGPIVRRTVTELHLDGGSLLFLDGTPDGALTITEAWSSETPVAVEATDFTSDPGGIVRRWSGRWANRVTVTYSAGRFASTETVDEPFTTAAGLLLHELWRPTQGGGSETYGLDLALLGGPDWQKVLGNELRGPSVA